MIAIERKKLEQVLEELERLDLESPYPIGVKSIPTLRESLAQPEQPKACKHDQQCLSGLECLCQLPLPVQPKQPVQAASVAAIRAQKAIQLARKHLIQLGDKLPMADDKELIDSFHALTPLTITPPLPVQEPVAEAYALADKVRTELDKQCCPGVYMNLAWEAVTKNYTTPARAPAAKFD